MEVKMGDNNEVKGTDVPKEEKSGTNQEGIKTEPKEKDEVKTEPIDEGKVISEYLKKIGLADGDSVEDIIKKHNEDIEKNKTDLEKKNDIVKKTTKKYLEEKERADEAEAKLIAYQLGCKKELVDDVVIIAKSKLEDGKTMSDIITEIKKSDRGSFFFDSEDEEDEETTKTRKTKSNTRGIVKEEGNTGKEKESVVDRLFKNKKEKKSYYFKN